MVNAVGNTENPVPVTQAKVPKQKPLNRVERLLPLNIKRRRGKKH